MIAPRPPRPPAAHVAGKVLGFRQWTLDGYKLRSAAVHAWWKIGENEATCLASATSSWLRSAPPVLGPHEAPHPDCDCGLYAWHEPPPAWGDDQLGVIFGAVLAWGRIEVHADGFRARYAEPVILAYSPAQPWEQVERTRAIAGEMGVPFVELSELEARARQLGSPIASELRPPRMPSLTAPGFFSASVGAPPSIAVPTAIGPSFHPHRWGTAANVVLTPPGQHGRTRRRVDQLIGSSNAGAAGANLADFVFAGQHAMNLVLALLTAVLAALFLRRGRS